MVTSEQIAQNWLAASFATCGVLGSLAFSFLSWSLSLQWAAIALSIYAIAITIINANDLFVPQPDPTEELKAIILLLVQELRKVLLQLQYRHLEGF